MIDNYICIDVDTLEYIWEGLLCCLYSIEKNTPFNTSLVVSGNILKQKYYIEYLLHNFRIKEIIPISIPDHVFSEIKNINFSPRDKIMWLSTLMKIQIGATQKTEKHILVHDYDMTFTSNFNIDEIENYKSDFISWCRVFDENIFPQKIKNPDKRDFYNSGFMIINTENYKFHIEKIYKFLLENNFKFRLHDQSLLNKYVKINRIPVTSIPKKYNRLVRLEGFDEREDAVIHYIGVKPWNMKSEYLKSKKPYSEEKNIQLYTLKALKLYSSYLKALKNDKKYIPYNNG